MEIPRFAPLLWLAMKCGMGDCWLLDLVIDSPLIHGIESVKRVSVYPLRWCLIELVETENTKFDMKSEGKVHVHGTFLKELRKDDYPIGFSACPRTMMCKPHDSSINKIWKIKYEKDMKRLRLRDNASMTPEIRNKLGRVEELVHLCACIKF
ncbi:hypothetical protein EPI10_015413 [Gossypium australe]|uniref:Uncharacterized protein n=1 Tax=Gossypium australe TaxID=47621 RepID=A0A5B6VKI9_9ROSI|nr:hypothetical protein EPI10_015413 [Gossypium australe]